ncbi:homoserine dehydrogenase [Cellulomonas shaoxiangyii]|uniref:Homoserine dehydrogenase n=1 Tax=Cellulomonas shaoxiangyii TaxID=2566013 RepID=A0A4P7SLB8_9CELL|nr:homoserine dehydrogenase [Cellulomonas shaoxiangyii]QCB94297.1 homoserine dehydrogenase [Cellulomonas shaoxiangyii]TGY84520.1 homoserine dehydrogenase [Cellulomonas shaoxiangyii]
MPHPSSSAHPPLRVAVLGCGVVGTEVVRRLVTEADELAARVGAPLELVGVAVRDVDAERDPVVDRALLTGDADALVDKADVVVELIGGTEPARTLLLRAIEHGASVVTANKALLAQDGPTLYAAADAAGVDLYFEAAVAGAIPIVRPVRESLAGDTVRRVLGIVNGTTNYVLDRMATDGLDLDAAVAEAQALGYAEADPTADVEGYDAAAKAAILASLAFHTRVSIDDVDRTGITGVTADDVAWAARTGHVVKLLAIAERGADGDGVLVRVHPALVPSEHPLAGVRGAFNAVFVEAEAAGELMFYGRGAGGAPTSSAVLGDLVQVARHRVLGGKGPVESSHADLRVLDPGDARTRCQLRLEVADRPGVLARVATELAAQDVSIEAVRQTPPTDPATPGADRVATLVITTHTATERALRATVEAVTGLDVVHRVVSVLPVL